MVAHKVLHFLVHLLRPDELTDGYVASLFIEILGLHDGLYIAVSICLLHLEELTF